MTMPIRVQRKRIKGYKMPENTVSVTRPGKYGNPFKIGHAYKVADKEIFNAFIWMEQYDVEKAVKEGYTLCDTAEKAIELYEKYLKISSFMQKELKLLKGKNLACFCKEGQPCHADILLKYANQ